MTYQILEHCYLGGAARVVFQSRHRWLAELVYWWKTPAPTRRITLRRSDENTPEKSKYKALKR